MMGPPGYPSPSSFATLSKASPAASSRVWPMFWYDQCSAVLLGQVKMSVSARNHQSQHGEIHLAIIFLPFLEQHGMNVSFEMIHGDQRLVEGEGQRLGISDSDQQGARQPRPLGHRQRVNRLIGLPGIGQSFANHRHNRLQMLARSQLRNHAAIRLVRGDLREDDIRDDSLSRIHHRRGGLIAGAFNAENVGASHSF